MLKANLIYTTRTQRATPHQHALCFHGGLRDKPVLFDCQAFCAYSTIRWVFWAFRYNDMYKHCIWFRNLAPSKIPSQLWRGSVSLIF